MTQDVLARFRVYEHVDAALTLSGSAPIQDGPQYAVLLTLAQQAWLLHDTEGWAERAHEDGDHRRLARLDDLWRRLEGAQKIKTGAPRA